MRVGGLLLGVVLTACPLPFGKGVMVPVESPRAARQPSDLGVRAAFREVDITPEPGPPLYGWSSDGHAYSTGYWLRLKARVLALEANGERLAMVQLDLGAASTLMHRRIAKALAQDGIDPSRLVMSTTHTHAGPGGFFGDRFFNHMIPARNGFDEALTGYFVETIAAAVHEAFMHLKPARLAVAQEQVARDATSNRSIEAWRHNFDEGQRKPMERDGSGQLVEAAINHTLTLLRVDTQESPGAPFTPAGVWTAFAVHGNSAGYHSPLLHGDVHGLTARLTRSRLGLPEHFVAATTTGAEGDVAAGPAPGQNAGFALTYQVSNLVAEAAIRAFNGAEARIDAGGISLQGSPVAYDELSLRGAPTSASNLCPASYMSNAQVAGSEEGRAPAIAAWIGAEEGNTRAPAGCMSQRGEFAVFLKPLTVFLTDPDETPDVVPFQVVRLGKGSDGVVFTSVPGEATTEIGHRIERAVRGALNPTGGNADAPAFAVLGLTNGYVTYITTGPEYLAQAYEGGNTMYGGQEGDLFVEEFGRLTGLLGKGRDRWHPRREFWPGPPPGKAFVPDANAPRCQPMTWSAQGVKSTGDARSFTWLGAKPGERCRPPAHVRVECETGGAWRVPVDADGLPQSDDGRALEVSQKDATWTALWQPGASSRFGKCRFAVAREGGDLFSNEFSAPGAP